MRCQAAATLKLIGINASTEAGTSCPGIVAICLPLRQSFATQWSSSADRQIGLFPTGTTSNRTKMRYRPPLRQRTGRTDRAIIRFMFQRYGPNNDGGVYVPVNMINQNALGDPDFSGVASGGSAR